MKDIIIQLFGEYTPQMTDFPVVEVIDGVEQVVIHEVVANGVAGLDWPWLVGVALFAIVLWSLFRILGVFFK